MECVHHEEYGVSQLTAVNVTSHSLFIHYWCYITLFGNRFCLPNKDDRKVCKYRKNYFFLVVTSLTILKFIILKNLHSHANNSQILSESIMPNYLHCSVVIYYFSLYLLILIIKKCWNYFVNIFILLLRSTIIANINF